MKKIDIVSIDSDNIEVQDIKYIPSSFNNDILFVLPPVALGLRNAHVCLMNDLNKICDGHPWCTTKITNIQNEFGLSFRRFTCASHLQCPDDYM